MLLYLQFEIDISVCYTMSNVSTYISLVCLLVVVSCDNNVTDGTDVTLLVVDRNGIRLVKVSHHKPPG